MLNNLTHLLLNSAVFALLGIVIFIAIFYVIEKMTPENLWKELLEKQNLALAIMGAALMLSLAFIIGMAIHG